MDDSDFDELKFDITLDIDPSIHGTHYSSNDLYKHWKAIVSSYKIIYANWKRSGTHSPDMMDTAAVGIAYFGIVVHF